MKLKALIPSAEKHGAIAVLISLSDVTSQSKIEALYDYYCTGHTLTGACAINSVDESNFRKTVLSIDSLALKIQKYNFINGVERIDRNRSPD